MFDANACAIELLKMKNSEEIQKVAATSSVLLEGECVEASLKLVSVSDIQGKQTLSTSPPKESSNPTAAENQNVTNNSNVIITNNHSNTSVNVEDSKTTDESISVPIQFNSDSQKQGQVIMETEPPAVPDDQQQQPNSGETSSPEETPMESSTVVDGTVPSVPTATANVSSGSNNNNSNMSTTTATNSSTASVVEDGERMMLDSSSDDEEDEIYVNQFARDNMGSENNDPSSAEEAVIKRNTAYLIHRYTSLMHRVQGIMQATAGRHISKQLKAVLELPAFNQSLVRNIHYQGFRSSGGFNQDNNSEMLTKQTLSELQFAGKLMTNIIRHSMGNQLDPNDDSATEDSDSDDDEIVLPNERLMAEPVNASSESASYLPAENNPFIDAIKLEKQYEARRTALEFSINECEYSLTKSVALRRHCKASKPTFQLKKPAASSNVINIPVDASSSVKFYHDRKPVTTRRCIDHDDEGISNSNSGIASLDISRVSDMMQENDKGKNIGVSTSTGNGNSNPHPPSPRSENCVSEKNSELSSIMAADIAILGHTNNEASSSSDPIPEARKEEVRDHNAFIPSLKTTDSGGVSVLGVEFVNVSDPNQSSSRCSAIKRPEKNRKVFQLGGIQNILRDPAGVPTVSCTCFGRKELCALCLGRAQKKTGVNHVFMTRRDKLAILDETFHKTLSFANDVPLEVLLTSSTVEGAGPPLIPKSSSVQQLIKNRSQHFPPDFLETGPRPKKPRTYDIKPYVEAPTPTSPKKDSRFGDESLQAIRKRTLPRKSQSSFEDRDGSKMAGKGLGWPMRERKDSMRRTRNQEFDIDNIVIPYSIAAATRVEQLVYKPIETPRWRVLDYSEIFSTLTEDKNEGELEDMSNAAFLHRHNKCEADEKKRFTISLQKALNSTRKTRRLDSTCRSESTSEGGAISSNNPANLDTQVQSPGKPTEKEPSTSSPAVSQSSTASATTTATSDDQAQKGSATPTPVADNATVITEAMATQALKSLFKVGRRRTISTSTATKPEEEEENSVVMQIVDPWPQRVFPLPEEDFKAMVETMQHCDLQQAEGGLRRTRNSELMHCDDSIGSPSSGM